MYALLILFMAATLMINSKAQSPSARRTTDLSPRSSDAPPPSAQRSSPSGRARPRPRRNASTGPMQNARPSSPSGMNSPSRSSTSSEEWLPPARQLSGDWNRSPMARRGSAAAQRMTPESPRSVPRRASAPQRMVPDSPRSAPRRSAPRRMNISQSGSLDSAGYRASKSASPSRNGPDSHPSPSEVGQGDSPKQRTITRSPSPNARRLARANSYESLGPPLFGGTPSPSDPYVMRQALEAFQHSRDVSPLPAPSPPRSPFPLRLEVDPAEINAAIRRSASGQGREASANTPSSSNPTDRGMSRRAGGNTIAPELQPRTHRNSPPRSGSPSRPHLDPVQLQRLTTPPASPPASPPRPHLDPAQLQRLSGQPHSYLDATQHGSNYAAVALVQSPNTPPTDDRLPLEALRIQQSPPSGVTRQGSPRRQPHEVNPTISQHNGGGLWSNTDMTSIPSQAGMSPARSPNGQEPESRP